MKKSLTERQKTIMYILGFVIAAIAALLVYMGAIVWTMINGGIFVVFMYFIMIPVATLIFWIVAGLYSKITRLFLNNMRDSRTTLELKKARRLDWHLS